MMVTRQRKAELDTKKRSTRLQGLALRHLSICGLLGVSLLAASRFWRLAKFPRKTPDNGSIQKEMARSAHVRPMLSESHRICRVPPDQTFGYVCQGPEYDGFADKLTAFIEEEAPSRPATWGKRVFPFPANSTILAVGNSLTRQLFEALPCQYPDALVSWIDREANSTNPMRRATFYEGTFANGAKLYLVTNHAMFYSPKWPEFLSRFVGVENFDGDDNDRTIDAFVVGHINHFMNAYNTSFMELMKEQTKDWGGANFETIWPPTLQDFAELYNGPIVGVSMMADWSWYDQDYLEMSSQADQLKNLTGRENIRLVHGRKYVPRLGECGSNAWQYVGECQEAPDQHRCIGSRGGHPDLIAWDTVEVLHDLLSQEE
jgi:hypothetical protein